MDLLTRSRAGLLDALDALVDHRDALIVIGAQAIYLRTPAAPVALAEATKDSDLALDPRRLDDDPVVEEAMTRARFYPNPDNQPGAWMSPAGIPVDLMVAEALAGHGSKNSRGARIPPHGKRATRRARGLEAAMVDNSVLEVGALDPDDARCYRVRVAGSAALLVAKVHKLAERMDTPRRLEDKDAHDIYRILVGIDTGELAQAFTRLLDDPLSSDVSGDALENLAWLFAAGPSAQGSLMAGRAELGIGEPETVAVAVAILASDLCNSLQR